MIFGFCRRVGKAVLSFLAHFAPTEEHHSNPDVVEPISVQTLTGMSPALTWDESQDMASCTTTLSPHGRT